MMYKCEQLLRKYILNLCLWSLRWLATETHGTLHNYLNIFYRWVFILTRKSNPGQAHRYEESLFVLWIFHPIFIIQCDCSGFFFFSFEMLCCRSDVVRRDMFATQNVIYLENLNLSLNRICVLWVFWWNIQQMTKRA